MGYAVDYKPTRKRTGRKQSPANKTKIRNLRAMVKYALPNIEQRCACSDTITRPELMALIGLSTKNPATTWTCRRFFPTRAVPASMRAAVCWA